MREKKWTDCPICGARQSVEARKVSIHRFHPQGYTPLDIEGLDGQFCEACGDGFWSLKSDRKITRLVVQHMAKEDAGRLVANELASVTEAAEALHVTRQAVHKMMNEGRLRYVQTTGFRLPVRAALESMRGEIANASKKASARPRSSVKKRKVA